MHERRRRRDHRAGQCHFDEAVSGSGGFFGPGIATFNGGMSPGANPVVVGIDVDVVLGTTNTLAGTQTTLLEEPAVAGTRQLQRAHRAFFAPTCPILLSGRNR